MDEIQLKEQEQLKAMMKKVMQVVVEGDFVQSSLHNNTIECNQIFTMVNDWVGLLRRWNNIAKEF